MSIVVLGPSPPINVFSWQQGSSRIGYDNIMQRSDAIITATSEAADLPAVNVASWAATNKWRGGTTGTLTLQVSFPVAVTADSWGIHKHNLGDIGATIEAQSSVDGQVWSTFGVSKIFGADDNDTVFQFVDPSVNVQFYRLLITNAGQAPIIGNVFFGESLLLFGSPEIGWQPTGLALNNDFINSRSDGGDFIGRSLIRKGNKTSFQLSVVDVNWVRANWLPFMEAAEAHPWYFVWNPVLFAEEAAFCYTDKKIQRPSHSAPNHMTLGVSFIAL